MENEWGLMGSVCECRRWINRVVSGVSLPYPLYARIANLLLHRGEGRNAPIPDIGISIDHLVGE
jgi:hypothetical protein